MRRAQLLRPCPHKSPPLVQKASGNFSDKIIPETEKNV
jgi:hypothetical protein